jgi:alanine transaminase
LPTFFSSERDGYPSNPNHVFLTAGASAGVTLLLTMLIANPKSGILIPIPQYPLYTATLAAHCGVGIPYLLDEEADWATSAPEIEAAIHKAVAEGVEPKALVIINPGNPTGAVLDEATMERVIRLCEQHNLVLLADEVYQSNLHARSSHPFTSFKGVTGECGRRGGYFECANIGEDIIALVYKMVSVGLCPPLGGQIGMDCMVRAPRPGDASYALWKAETDATHAALAQRTKTMAARLNALPGVSCVDSPGALYLFPRIRLPAAAIEAARKVGKEPDTLYALELLDDTGICVVPGSGFGQKEGQYHYRLTCLCPGVEEYVGALERFHGRFIERYGAL